MPRRLATLPLLFALFLALLFALVFALAACGAPPSASPPSARSTTGVLAASSAAPGATLLRTGGGPGSVVVADFNRDGKPDLAVANALSNDLTVLLGDGHGAFAKAPGSPFAAGHSPNDVAAGDFNGDGALDLAFANHDAPYLTVLLGDGKGGFRPAPGSPVPAQSRPHPHGIAAADFNGDGKLDLAVESWGVNKVEVLPGDGKGAFAHPGALYAVGQMPYERLRAGDLNGDGLADLVTTNFEGANVSVLLADGKGGFRDAPGAPFPAGPSPFGVAIGDLDGDHHPDLAVVNYSGQGTDFSRDGDHVLLGDGKGSFRLLAGSPFPTGHAPVRIALGDLDGDGRPEIATANYASSDVTILRRAASGGYAVARTVAAGRNPQGLALTDLNGDGKADLLVCDLEDNDVRIVWGPLLR